jgi:hypothetical protein
MKMRAEMPTERKGAYLAASTIYRDDAEYLPEWIEFHRLLGVERFFLYDNGSTDDHRDVLAPYAGEGTVMVHDWAGPFMREDGRPIASTAAFEHCVGAHREDARWITFLDVDEFLFSPTGAPLPEVLREYEQFPGVVVNRAEFGPSGHETKPAGLVIESYVQRRRVRPDEEVPHKSIVDPSRVQRCLGAHSFVYHDGLSVNEDRRPVDMGRSHSRSSVAWSRLRVHHYWSRSEEERRRKAERWEEIDYWRAPRRSARFLQRESIADAIHPVTDDSLTGYAPAVREALARRTSLGP